MDELSILEERIQDKIAETKIQMVRTPLRIETDRLWPIIETLQWVLNEILDVIKQGVLEDLIEMCSLSVLHRLR
jgi:hypothetical protein